MNRSKEVPMQDRLPLSEVGTTVWPPALVVTAVLGSLVAACMFPFVGVATLAAATMSRRNALLTVIGAWSVNQAIGYLVLGYPQTTYSFAWGAAIGVASLTAAVVARAVMGGHRQFAASRLVAGFATAFIAYEALLYTFAHVAGGLNTFSPAIIGQIALNDAMWFAGLLGLRVVLSTVAPNLFGARPALRFA